MGTLNSFIERITSRALNHSLITCCTLGIPLFLCASSFAGPKPEIIVVLTGFQSDSGHVLVSLHDRAKSFPGDADGAKKLARAKINGKKAVLRFIDLESGRYAISTFHDENDNEKLDTNFLGIPKEAVGASNNASGTLGPPKWKDAVFEYKQKSLTQRITLKKP
jgi:uncharacterized protein (DUF2141 family)